MLVGFVGLLVGSFALLGTLFSANAQDAGVIPQVRVFGPQQGAQVSNSQKGKARSCLLAIFRR